MSDADTAAGCRGTAIEHAAGGWECTDQHCAVELESHVLRIGCDDVGCRCVATATRTVQDGPRGSRRG